MKIDRVMVGMAFAMLCVACHRNDSGSKTKAADRKLDWLTNYSAAQTRARAENKMLLMNFTGSDWCPPCIKLHREVFSQPQFADYAANYLVLLEVDFPRTKVQSAEQKLANEKLSNQYGVYWFPTVIILDPGGKKLGELGYTPGGPKAFIADLEKLHQKTDR
jgi:protein disulfide-isomerase